MADATKVVDHFCEVCFVQHILVHKSYKRNYFVIWTKNSKIASVPGDEDDLCWLRLWVWAAQRIPVAPKCRIIPNLVGASGILSATPRRCRTICCGVPRSNRRGGLLIRRWPYSAALVNLPSQSRDSDDDKATRRRTCTRQRRAWDAGFYLSVNRASPLPRNLVISPDAIAAAPLLPLMLPLPTRDTDCCTDCVASSTSKHTAHHHLRKRSHGLELTAVQSSFLRNNFVYRMLYTDIYWNCVSLMILWMFLNMFYTFYYYSVF